MKGSSAVLPAQALTPRILGHRHCKRRNDATAESERVALPDTLAARYVVLTRRMLALGPNLGEPHTKAFGDGLFELRLMGAEGIARVFFCTFTGKGIVMLHNFVKKSKRTPVAEREIAIKRIKELKRADT